jgi:hypothetical protein
MKVDVISTDIRFIEIFNITGRRILTKEVSQGTTNIDLNSLPKGMYMVSFKGAGVIYTKKFIKK